MPSLLRHNTPQPNPDLLAAGGTRLPLLGWITQSDEVISMWRGALQEAGRERIFQQLLDALDVRITCAETDLLRIPESGPVVLVANHPHGLLDGFVLASLVSRRRRDWKFLANSILCSLPQAEHFAIPVDVFGGRAIINGVAARSAIRWLNAGGVLITFPAGEVSAINGLPPVITDRVWSDGPLKLAARTNARVIHVHLSGRNSLAFQMAGLAHPALRTLLLGRELLNKRGYSVEVSIGKAVPATTLANGSGEHQRRRTYILGARNSVTPPKKFRSAIKPALIAPPVSATHLEADLQRLAPDRLIFESGEFAAYAASASELPDVMREIGRLRELTFRAAGEGTGKPADLDRFDEHYTQLFLWNRDTREIVGGYRLGPIDRITNAAGIHGLYTRSLFAFGHDFLERVTPGIELGRSFVRPEYQKRPQPLYFLWRGIGAFLGRNPRYRFLFGPVSISNEYRSASRQLIMDYFQGRSSSPVAPAARHPFGTLRLAIPGRALLPELASIEELAGVVSDIETDGKGLPVLLRQYINLGAEVLAFNVDPHFANALDALIVVDLLRSPRAALARYMGQQELAEWLSHHSREAS